MIEKQSAYRMGWILVMFDLPVLTDEKRRTASRFRKELLDSGYLMIQFSIYARPSALTRQRHSHQLPSWQLHR